MMKKYITFIFLFFFSLVLFVSTGCETTPVRLSPLPGEPVAHLPKMMVGDTWVLTDWSRKHGIDTYTAKIVSVEPDGSFTVETKGEKSKKTQMLNYDNRARQINPPSKANRHDFPLFVGKKWSDKYYGKSIDGSYYHYENDYIVKKYETVVTKAGTFKAFKIFQRPYLVETGSTATNEYWYSPEVKFVVKAKPSWKTGRELLSYQLASVDKTPPVIEISSPKMGRGITIVKRAEGKIAGTAKDDSDIKWLKINNKEVPLNELGKFSYAAHLSNGENVFEVKASDVHGNETLKTVAMRYDAPKILTIYKEKSETPLRKPSCWVLSAGISQYKDNNLSLKYAHNDAISIAHTMKDQEGKLFSEVFVKTLVNEKCTRGNIMENLADHLGMAGPDDVAFIFIAGHGVKHKQTGSYYFLTYNANSKNVIYEGLRWSDFEEALKILATNVNKVVLVLDTCHAGSMKAYMRGVEWGEDLSVVLKQSSG
ncbi:MAG: caspase family protein, partial [Deltaproteobacteria bacterium]|nr:caspase family protein [Deltaproteobacteria bacterium]